MHVSVSPVRSQVLAGASGHYVHWGVVQISLTNLLIIVAMVLLFVAALVVPFPGGRRGGRGGERS